MNDREIAGNRDTGLLKIIALVCMIIDHVGARILTQYSDLRVIGRIAFPLYIWCMAVGATYTRCRWKYALRLLLVGLIAQPCYMLGLNHQLGQWSIFMTLFLGYLGIWAIQENWYGSRWWGPLAALAAASFITMDYGWRGVLLIMLVYLTRQNRGALAAVMIAFCLYWGSNSYPVQQLFGFKLNINAYPEILRAFLRIQALAILALPLMLWPCRRRTPFPKWLGYAVYPGHLLILWLVQLLMGSTTLQASLRLFTP